MKNKQECILRFCDGSNYIMIRYDDNYGKIIDNLSIDDLKKTEIHRSIMNKDESMLFIYKITDNDTKYVMNPIQLLLQSLEEARAIEAVYPHIFNWVFDGLHLKAYALIPSNDNKAHTTLTRYGGSENFYKILIQHLDNIGKMKKGLSPNYNFGESTIKIQETELSIGSINKKTDLYSININLNFNYKKILINSKKFINGNLLLNTLNMKYWASEINPDFITEAKHIKLEKTVPYFDKIYDLYPLPIKRIMNLKHKGNYNRYLISRFLLNIHSPKDAKFIYYSILADEELEHIKSGNCSTQWNYIRNNIKKYDCPSLKEIKNFIHPDDPPIVHLLEYLQDWIEKKEEEKKNE